MISKHRPQLPAYSKIPAQYKGPSLEQTIAWRKRYVNPTVGTYYQDPLMIVQGSMQYVFNEKGRRYLDAFAGIATISVGHCHPYVVDAVQQQTSLLQHATTVYLHPTISEYAKMLAERMPESLSVVYFVNSGSEANELALLMSRLYTGNYDVIALRNGYHGMTNSSMGLTSHSTWKYNIPQSFGVHHARNADLYRGPWRYGDENAGEKYAEEIQNIIQYATPGQIAGFFSESIQGVGGTIVYPEGYLKSAYKHVRRANGLCIADEVQTGFCRTGNAFFGFESHGVVPDIVTMAKGIGNGVPLAAVVTRPEIAKVLTHRTHFNTFGGNPISCGAGKAVLEVIDADGLLERSRTVGAHLLKGLELLKQKYECIGDVRGSGLMIGVELVKNRETHLPAPLFATRTHEQAKEHGLLLGLGGFFRNVLRIKPPLCFSYEDADFTLEVLELCFQTIVE